MRVTALARYARMGASSRLRLYQYLQPLQAAGHQARVHPFFDDLYLERLYSGQGRLGPSLRAYAGQIGALRTLADQDLIWLEKEALPWIPFAIERACFPRSVPIVADYDDAVFHRYDLHGSWTVRNLLGQKINRVMANAALITAGNTYLADRARAAGATHIEIVPTVVDLDQYAPRVESGSNKERARIGWVGTPSTWTEFMRPMLPELTELAREHEARFLVVGAGEKEPDETGLVDHLSWTEAGEVADIQRMDIGLMPLIDTPWARGKCGYKLIQYMACGLPVVASPVGVNAEIVEHGVNGFLATTERDWREALNMLLRNPSLRQQMGAAGRRKVEARYSLQIWGPRVAELLSDVVHRYSAN